MSIVLSKATPPPTPRTDDAKGVALFYAVILVIFALTQLFTYDTFLLLVATFNLPGGVGFTYLITSLLVIAEVFALPFLLRMPLSHAFRWFSMICGWIVPAIWMFFSLWLVTTDSPVSNVGFLGTLIETIPGWWAVFMSGALGLLAFWASWGMWPSVKKKKSRK